MLWLLVQDVVQWHGAMMWCNDMVQCRGATSWCNDMVHWRGAMVQWRGAMTWCNDVVQWRGAMTRCNVVMSWCNDMVQWRGAMTRCNGAMTWCNVVMSWCNDMVQWRGKKDQIHPKNTKYTKHFVSLASYKCFLKYQKEHLHTSTHSIPQSMLCWARNSKLITHGAFSTTSSTHLHTSKGKQGLCLSSSS